MDIRDYDKVERYVGETRGKLTCVGIDKERTEKHIESGKYRIFILCKCQCNEHKIISRDFYNFKNGQIRSCGCVRREVLIEKAKEKARNLYSLRDWCMDNNREGLLNLFDAELNDRRIEEILCKTSEKINFRCEKCGENIVNIKVAELTRHNSSVVCAECNSFYNWCTANNKEEYLESWDYERNTISPKEISYGSGKKVWFKCPEGLHDGCYMDIAHITSSGRTPRCKGCSSIGQWLINKHGEDGIEKYWDFEKNSRNPFEVQFGDSKKKIWLKCANEDTPYHGSYEVLPNSVTSGKCSCPYCAGQRVHPLDSLATKRPEVLGLWSEKNEKSPYAYLPHSSQYAWFKCRDGQHEDYRRRIDDSVYREFRCPACYTKSWGELRIRQFLESKNITFEHQKKYRGLVGVGNKPLSYDFYIPGYGLIEYQGKFHDGTDYYKDSVRYKRQQEHDRRKRNYAKQQSISLLEIWYDDYHNIEEILTKELSNLL